MKVKIRQYNISIAKIIFCLSISIFLLSLGIWQLVRFGEKTALIKEALERSSLPAMDFSSIDKLPPEKYTKLVLKGEYLHDKEMFLYFGNKSETGKDGYMLITPLKTIEGNIILVNRGWIPVSAKPSLNRLETLEPGIIEVSGYTMLEERKNWFMPDNDFKKNIWFYMNLKEMEDYVGLAIEKFYILREYENDNLPIARKANFNFRNPHLEYAITWFALAIAFLVIFIMSHKDLNLKK